MIPVILADDQQIILEGLKTIALLDKDISVETTCLNGKEVLAYLETHPDFAGVVLMDVRMPVMDGIQATKAITSLYPAAKVLILTSFEDDEYIFSTLVSGSYGYILKSSPPSSILQAIKAVAGGQILVNPGVMSRVMDSSRRTDAVSSPDASSADPRWQLLSNREREIVQMVASGKKNKEIASALFITEGTVKNHISNIYEKLEINSRSQLVRFAMSGK